MKGLRTLTYCPELNQLTGGITATLLLTQLEYWFNRKEGKSFFKFLAPCDHDYYREGDSWTEELGFSKAEFRHAFSQIGTVYKSKTAYQRSEDPFQGRMYLSYYDRIKKLTVYERNHHTVNKLLNSCIDKYEIYKYEIGNYEIDQLEVDQKEMHRLDENKNKMHRLDNDKDKDRKQERVNDQRHREQLISTKNVKNRRYQEGELGSKDIENKKNRLNKDNKINQVNQINQMNTGDKDCYIDSESKLGINKDYKQSLPHRVTTDKLVDIYHQICPSLPKVDKLTSKHQQLINKLYEIVGDNLEQIKQVFTKLEASDFLSGRLQHSTWQSSFEWILNPTNFNKVKAGKYDSYQKEKPKSVFLRTYTHNFDLDKLEALAFQRQQQVFV